MALINCPECNKEVSDKAEICPHCGYKILKIQPMFQGVYCPSCLDSSIRAEENECCPFCHIKVKNSISGTLDECYAYSENHPELKQSPDFNQEAYNKRINYIPGEYISVNSPKCPTCGSSNISKIGTLNRVVSTGIFGLASSKIGKQWHCKACGSDF